MTQERKRRRFSLTVLGICLLFYMGFLLIDGPVWCVDSHTYVEMDMSREMLYPLYLAALRRCFAGLGDRTLYGLPVYLFAAAFLASLLNALAVWRITSVTHRYMSKISRRAGLIAGWGMLMFQLAVPLMNRFLANRQSMYSTCIMTESLAMPLYILFCTELWIGLYEDRKRNLIAAFLIIFIQINLRKQMTVCLLILLCMSFLLYVLRFESRKIGRFIMHVLIAVLILSGSSSLERYYHLRLDGAAINRTNDNKTWFCNLMYTADEEDAALFDLYGQKEDKEIFLELMALYEEQGVLFKNAPEDGNLYVLQDHYAQSYDVIGIDIAMPVIGAHIVSDDHVEYRLLFDETTDRINSVLIHQDLRDLVGVVFRNIIEGFADSVAKLSPRLVPIIAAVYAAFAVLYVMLWNCLYRSREAQKAQPAEASVEEFDKSAVPAVNETDRQRAYYGGILAAEITMGGILINIGVVGITIFAQPRYMIYGMGMFYGVMLCMLLIAASKKMTKEPSL